MLLINRCADGEGVIGACEIGEELLALRAAGVPCEAVPGVSSAVAIPELAGIPVTHRGLSRSFHVVTAHTANTPDGLPEDFDRLAGLSGTLVFLMGAAALPEITAVKPELLPRIRFALEQADLSGYPDSMRPLVLKDIVAALQKMDSTEP